MPKNTRVHVLICMFLWQCLDCMSERILQEQLAVHNAKAVHPGCQRQPSESKPEGSDLEESWRTTIGVLARKNHREMIGK